jgi:hypothetical protein
VLPSRVPARRLLLLPVSILSSCRCCSLLPAALRLAHARSALPLICQSQTSKIATPEAEKGVCALLVQAEETRERHMK